ncbi:MAG: hypothetical protein HWE26_08630 [Alteromonadaceae bacterium]|nr:hypothetical protein [Alteromonadaceae bacterium]
MQPSNSTQQPAGSSSSHRPGETPVAAPKQIDINNTGIVLRPVTAASGNSQATRQTSVLQTPQKQAIQVTPAVSSSSADSLVLMKLPTSTPVQLSPQTTVELTQLLSQPAVEKTLAALIKLSPEALSQPLSKAQIQSLVTVLVQAHRTPLSMPVEIVSLNNNTLHLQIGGQDGGKKNLVEIPIAQLSQVLANTSGAATKSSAAALLANLTLPAKATLTLTPPALTPARTAWQASITLRSTAGIAGGAAAEPGNITFKAPLQATAQPLQALFKVALTQGVSPNLTSVTQWAENSLPARSVQQLQSLSQLTPVSVGLKGDSLMISGSRAQIMAVDAAPTKSLLNALPTLNQHTIKQLNSQALSSAKLPPTELSFMQGNPASSHMNTSDKGSTSDNVTLQRDTSSHSSGKTSAEQMTLKREASLAQLKVAALSSEAKSAIETFIRTANRLNVVNTNSQPASVANIVDALQKMTKFANVTEGTSQQQTSVAQNKGATASAISSTAPVATGTNGTAAKALSAIIAQLQLDIHSISAASAEHGLTSNNTGETGTNPKVSIANAQQVSAAIKQLMISPAWLQSPGSLLNPPAGQSFINGLLQVLQVSLLGRHYKQHTDLEQAINRSKSAAGSTSVSGLLSSLNGRQVREFAQLDSQQNLLKQLKGLLAGHQSAKLANLDQALQGQDSFYYVLPALHHNQQASEILIRRDKDSKDNNEKEAEGSSWNLTMKLSIGEHGELLTKVKIKSEQIFLDIYTSNQDLLEKVGLTLPFLLKRFALLGLDVQEHKVQLGKIPDSLATKPFQLLETQA